MLDDLDLVPWAELTHAYGPADDVPDQIRALASSDKERREKAMWSLYGNIFHQGTRYQATPYVVPFLLELLQDSRTQAKPELVTLLVHLALGYEESLLPTGVNTKAYREYVETAEQHMSAEERTHCEKYGFGPQSDLDCYDSVLRIVPELIALFHQETDPDIHQTIIYLLGWFPEEAENSIPLIQDVVETESHVVPLANAILSLNLLTQQTSHSFDSLKLSETMEAYLHHKSLLIRTATAIALATESFTEDVIQVLIEALISSKQLQEEAKELSFNEGNMAGYVSRVLSKYGKQHQEQIVPHLCETLKHVNVHQSLDVTGALLVLVMNVDVQTGKLIPFSEETAFESLTALQQTALRAIANDGGWKIGESGFANYSLMIRDFGLPGTYEQFLVYVKN